MFAFCIVSQHWDGLITFFGQYQYCRAMRTFLRSPDCSGLAVCLAEPDALSSQLDFHQWSLMLGLHRSPEELGTYDQKMTKLVVTRELVGKVVCSSYVTHKKVISYSWILAITRAHSPLKSTSSTIAFNRQKRSWNLSISLASDPTRSWILLWSQVFVGWSWFILLPRMPFGTVVNRSQVTLEIFTSCKLLPSDTGNSRRSRPGRRSVANRSQSITCQLEVGRKCITAVGPWS